MFQLRPRASVCLATYIDTCMQNMSKFFSRHLSVVFCLSCRVVCSYEIQLCEEVRRKGLGKFLMQILELMAFK